MDQYRRVETKKPEIEIKDDEIRLTAQGRQSRHYVNYALKKLGHYKKTIGEGEESKEEEKVEGKPLRSIRFRAMGQAINATVIVAEVVKRLVPGLHQITSLSSSEITDVYEPLVEGLRTVVVKRRVPSIEITLSKDPLDTTDVGYQPPEEVKEMPEEKKPANRGNRRRNGRGRGRGRRRGGGRGKEQGAEVRKEGEQTEIGGEEAPPGEPGKEISEPTKRGRGRGRRRGRRGRRGRGRGRRGGRSGNRDGGDSSNLPGEEGKAEGAPSEGGKAGEGKPSSSDVQPRRGRGRRGGRRGRRRGRRSRRGAPRKFSDNDGTPAGGEDGGAPGGQTGLNEA
ncbi:hypothetical protein AAMO2058_000590600 [Amorphochlora amoebiformis]|eukprot:901337-Amorphochlora_amoeboformis.AAC.1